jgi:hypothetical protein
MPKSSGHCAEVPQRYQHIYQGKIPHVGDKINVALPASPIHLLVVIYEHNVL